MTETLTYSIRDIVNSVTSNLIKEHLRISVEGESEEPIYSGENASNLERIFYEMYWNSVEADSNEWHVETYREGNNNKIKISDNGTGIDTDKISIGEVFGYRMSTKSDKRGFGLFATHLLVMKYDGDISVDNIFGEGVAFTISLPQTMHINQEVKQYFERLNV